MITKGQQSHPHWKGTKTKKILQCISLIGLWYNTVYSVYNNEFMCRPCPLMERPLWQELEMKHFVSGTSLARWDPLRYLFSPFLNCMYFFSALFSLFHLSFFLLCGLTSFFCLPYSFRNPCQCWTSLPGSGSKHSSVLWGNKAGRGNLSLHISSWIWVPSLSIHLSSLQRAPSIALNYLAEL